MTHQPPIRRDLIDRRRPRSGLAALEVVMTTAAMIPALMFAAYLGFRMCRIFFAVVGSMVGSPLL
jgi:hypothetical protein